MRSPSLAPASPKVNDVAAAILVLAAVALIWGGVFYVAITVIISGLL